MNVERSALDFSNIRGMREGESVRPTPRSKCIQPMSVMMSRKSATLHNHHQTIQRFPLCTQQPGFDALRKADPRFSIHEHRGRDQHQTDTNCLRQKRNSSMVTVYSLTKLTG
jgi:hypothetical protein